MDRAQLIRTCFSALATIGLVGCGESSPSGGAGGWDTSVATDVTQADDGLSVPTDTTQGLVGKDDGQVGDTEVPPPALDASGGEDTAVEDVASEDVASEDVGGLVDAPSLAQDVSDEGDAAPAKADGAVDDVAQTVDAEGPKADSDDVDVADVEVSSGEGDTGGEEPPLGSTCPASSGLQPGAAWPMRSACPDHRGRSAHPGPESGTLAWSVALGPSHQQPVIDAEGRIYVADDLGVVHALSSDGEVLWTLSLLSMGGGTSYTALTTPLLAATGELIVGTADGFVHAVDAAGQIVWSAPTGGAVTGDPVIDPDGTIVVATDSGSVRWISSTGGELGFNFIAPGIDAAPAMADHDDVFLGPVDGLVRRLGLATGLSWSTSVGSASHQAVAIADSGVVYAAGHVGASPFGDKHTDLHALQPTTGTVTWSTPIGNLTPQSPIIGPGGQIHVPVSRGHQFVVCALVTITADGEVAWAHELDDYCAGDAVVDNKGRVFMASRPGHVAAVDADGTPSWSVQLDESDAMNLALGFGGRLYVMQSTGTLVAFSEGL